MESGDITMEKISTMSLGEFRNLLNTNLAVPNGTTDSLGSDSPRSQSSVDSYKTMPSKPGKKDKWAHVKSSYSYRSASSPRTSSAASDRTPTNQKTTGTPVKYGTKTMSNTSLKQTSTMDNSRPRTPTSISKSRSNMTSVSEPAYTGQNYASRSSSHSSLKSYESYDSHLLEDTSVGFSRSDRIPLTPSSINSDYSYSDTTTSQPESPGYSRSNSYTPGSSLLDRQVGLNGNVRASSEPRDIIPNRNEDTETKPLNVGYVSFSYQDKSEDKHLDELSEIDNEILQHSRQNGVDTVKSPTDDSSSTESSENRKKSFVGRPSTPSFIPRPMTPKMSRKMSVPETNDLELSVKTEDQRGRPPTPRKSNVIARASGANNGVKSADKSKEQTYKQIFQKRSTTPGPGSVAGTKTSTSTIRPERRSSTPGPYLHRTTQMSVTSATTTRARLNQTLETSRKRTTSASSLDNQENKPLSRPLSRQGSGEQSETVITVNRSGGQHSLTVHGRDKQQDVQKSKVLARARTEDNRARTQTRTQGGVTRQRPQSVEPRQLMPRKNSAGQVLSVRRGENGQHEVYDRTEEWVQTAVKQTSKTQKTKPARTVTTPRMRRAMTPNSFDKRVDMEDEEPRSLAEIKAALSLPINGINSIDVDKLDAPPEDPEAYYAMEKLFHELRQQELKASVNETPGSVTSGGRRSSRSKSNSSNNDEEMSLDSNKNVKRKTLSVSTKSSSNVTSPSLPRHGQGAVTSSRSQSSTGRPQPPSRASSTSSAGTSSCTKPGHTNPPRPASPRTTFQTNNYIRPSSPKTTVQSPNLAKSPVVARPSSPSPKAVVSSHRPPSPRTTVSNQRPPSPRTTGQPPRPESPRVGSQPPRPASPRVSTRRSPSPSPVNRQPPRPASTPPRPCTPVDRNTSKSIDDCEIPGHETKTASTLISKIKEIIKVKPRKDKAEGVKQKSRIPAPKSLSNVGKSRSFSNLSNLSDSMSLAHTETKNSMLHDPEENGYDDQINGGLNVTLSGRSETPKMKLITPMTTGRSTLIRKESMDKNKNTSRLSRVMSVERDMGGLQNTYQFYDDGEYV